MRVLSLALRDFRTYEDVEVDLGEGLTVVFGPNGVGKTNLLEGLYFACTGRSCRTNNEREVVRFGASATRAALRGLREDGEHELTVGFVPGEPKRMRADGCVVERMLDVDERPLVSVFLPDRLELVKGTPALRRAHLDQFVAALWPARAVTRRAYAQALAQRNALIARVRSDPAAAGALEAWDEQLALRGIELMRDRREAVDAVAPNFGRIAESLGLAGISELLYKPRSHAQHAPELAGELRARRESDIERGFTGHGPHRDELALVHQGRELRVYGSQGQQRLGLLALLLAERDALSQSRSSVPLLLLDDVMSELDDDRRQALIRHLRSVGGQSVITTTDLEHVPGRGIAGAEQLEVVPGGLRREALAA